jgi:hypothetical protein
MSCFKKRNPFKHVTMERVAAIMYKLALYK